jgi:hypothetical protein
MHFYGPGSARAAQWARSTVLRKSYWASQGAQGRRNSEFCLRFRRGLLVEQAELFGVVAAEEQVEEGVGGGAPILPALRPVGAAAIAGVFAEDGNGAGLFLARLGVKDQLGAALRDGRRTVWGGLRGLVGWIHWKAGLERK